MKTVCMSVVLCVLILRAEAFNKRKFDLICDEFPETHLCVVFGNDPRYSEVASKLHGQGLSAGTYKSEGARAPYEILLEAFYGDTSMKIPKYKGGKFSTFFNSIYNTVWQNLEEEYQKQHTIKGDWKRNIKQLVADILDSYTPFFEKYAKENGYSSLTDGVKMNKSKKLPRKWSLPALNNVSMSIGTPFQGTKLTDSQLKSKLQTFYDSYLPQQLMNLVVAVDTYDMHEEQLDPLFFAMQMLMRSLHEQLFQTRAPKLLGFSKVKKGMSKEFSMAVLLGVANGLNFMKNVM